ncbi:MAG: hypothetical protein AAFZ65_17100, partial [Planctomycetota bacterium]
MRVQRLLLIPLALVAWAVPAGARQVGPEEDDPVPVEVGGEVQPGAEASEAPTPGPDSEAVGAG